jgi:hypothetical protein
MVISLVAAWFGSSEPPDDFPLDVAIGGGGVSFFPAGSCGTPGNLSLAFGM